jgi:hypothetical protein
MGPGGEGIGMIGTPKATMPAQRPPTFPPAADITLRSPLASPQCPRWTHSRMASATRLPDFALLHVDRSLRRGRSTGCRARSRTTATEDRRRVIGTAIHPHRMDVRAVRRLQLRTIGQREHSAHDCDCKCNDDNLRGHGQLLLHLRIRTALERRARRRGVPCRYLEVRLFACCGYLTLAHFLVIGSRRLGRPAPAAQRPAFPPAADVTALLRDAPL